MFHKFKQLFYFPIAHYFRFWASIQLLFWKPRIIVITGSSGKTTTLHLLQSQLGNLVRYSHHANSSYGIPFDILGLKRETLRLTEWIHIFLLAPIRSIKKPYKENVYVVEADSDRPGEAKFLSTLLKPEIVIWLSSGRTHSMNFDSQVENGLFKTTDEAIAYEFGYFVENCQRLVIINSDNPNVVKQLDRTASRVIKVSLKQLNKYEVGKVTTYTSGKNKYSIPALLPREVFYSVEAIRELLDDLDAPFESNFSRYSPPSGRCSIFEGINKTTLIDSSYNANLGSMTAIINLFKEYQSQNKWMVIGDMLEQGVGEQREHERLADHILSVKPKRIILLGPRVSQFTYPILTSKIDKNTPIVKYENPHDVLVYLKENISGGEVILFKGARFLEGVIENLLKNKADANNLSRREVVWEERRKKWGL